MNIQTNMDFVFQNGNQTANTNYAGTRNSETLQDLNQYFSKFPEMEFRKDQMIYLVNSSSDNVYFIESGSVVTGNLSDTGEVVINVLLFKGQLFGEQALMGAPRRNEFAQAKERTVLREVPIVSLRNELKNSGMLSLAVNQLILKKMYQIQEKWRSQIVDYARTRVIDFILFLTDNNSRKVGLEYTVDNFFPHREIASIIGSSRQTVTVTLNELRSKNLIYFDRKRLIVRDRDQLVKERF